MERLVAYIVWVLALAAFLMVCYKAKADTMEFMGPVALTQHVINDPSASSQFANKVSKDGSLILNRQVGIIITKTDNDTFSSYGQWIGTNSVGNLMVGSIGEFGRSFGRYQLGTALGAYIQDDSGFKSTGIQPFQIAREGNLGLVPVGGIVFNAKLYQTPAFYIKLNTITSPILINLSLSVGVKW